MVHDCPFIATPVGELRLGKAKKDAQLGLTWVAVQASRSKLQILRPER
jgi:hypothetical protein